MKIISTLLVAVSLAIISVPAVASSHCEVWTTADGSAVVDSSGKPIKTIHCKEKKVALIKTPAVKSKINPVLVAEQQDVVLDPVKQAPKVAALKGITPTAKYTFNNYQARVLFDTDSATLSADASANLTQLVMTTGLAHSIVSVQVVGHADTRGDQAYNMSLSEQRMHSVTKFLDGLKLKVTSMIAKGETSPIVDDQGENLTKSRRVYIAIKTRHLKN